MKRIIVYGKAHSFCSRLVSDIVAVRSERRPQLRQGHPATDLSGGSRAKVIYYDGLGREEQTVMVGGSPAGGSVVSEREYDEYGREVCSWLQGAVSGNTTGSYVGPGTLEGSVSSSNDNDAVPYSLTLYEASPLNRPVTQYGPGAAWHAGISHSVRTEYLNHGDGYFDSFS